MAGSEALRSRVQSWPCLTVERDLGGDPGSLVLCPTLCLTPCGLKSPHLRGLGQWSLTALLSYCQWFWVRDEEVWGSGLEGLWEAASSRGSLQRDPRAKIAQVIFSCLGGGI